MMRTGNLVCLAALLAGFCVSCDTVPQRHPEQCVTLGIAGEPSALYRIHGKTYGLPGPVLVADEWVGSSSSADYHSKICPREEFDVVLKDGTVMRGEWIFERWRGHVNLRDNPVMITQEDIQKVKNGEILRFDVKGHGDYSDTTVVRLILHRKTEVAK